MLIGFAVILAAVGVALVLLALAGLRPNRAMLSTPTTPVSKLTPGKVELAGLLQPAGAAPLLGAAGTPCVLVHTLHEERHGRNNYREVGRETAAIPAVLRDATGECAVTLDHVELLGESWERMDSVRTRTTQILVPIGVPVVVFGVARLEQHPSQGDYRGGQRLVVGGTGEAPLIIAVGDQTGAVWRHGWRALVAMMCGLVLLVLAATGLLLRGMLAG